MIDKAKLAAGIGIVAFVMTACIPDVLACVGSRPLGMGGAFIAVADDVNSVYWNPAGFGRMKDKGGELTYTRLMNKRDDFNYDDYVAVGGKHFGVGYIHSKVQSKVLVDTGEDIIPGDFIMEDGSLNLALGGELFHEKFFFGVTAKRFKREFRLKTDNIKMEESDDVWALDLGFIWEITYDLAVAVLSQNLNEPTLRFDNFALKQEMVHNLRPGIAWKMGERLSRELSDSSIPEIIIAVDMYDALDNSNGKVNNEINAGIEIGMNAETYSWLNYIQAKTIRLRSGSYFLTNSEARAYTFGIGFQHETGFKLDYALMDWQNTSARAHWVSAGWRF